MDIYVSHLILSLEYFEPMNEARIKANCFIQDFFSPPVSDSLWFPKVRYYRKSQLPAI